MWAQVPRGAVLLLLLGLELLVHDLVLDGRRRPPFRHVPTLPSLPVHRPVLMHEKVLLITLYDCVVSIRFMTTATERRLVNPSNASPSSISMSCMRTSKALSTA